MKILNFFLVSEHFTGRYTDQGTHICVLYQRAGKVINGIVLDSVRPEHDVNDVK